jgi:hypothetical protein
VFCLLVGRHGVRRCQEEQRRKPEKRRAPHR